MLRALFLVLAVTLCARGASAQWNTTLCETPFTLDFEALFTACQAYAPCAESFVQPEADADLFAFLASQALSGVDVATDALEPVLCQESLHAIQERLVLLFLARNAERTRFCNAGEYGTFNAQSGTWECRCLPDHQCYFEREHSVATAIVIIALTGIAAVWLWRRTLEKLEPSS